MGIEEMNDEHDLSKDKCGVNMDKTMKSKNEENETNVDQLIEYLDRALEPDMPDPVGNDGKPWPQTFDGQAWAKAFNQTLVNLGDQPHDEGFLIGWFANAIMRGFDEANWQRDAAPQSAVREQYLLGGTRFKLSFNDKGDVSCFANYQVELDGQWVALVDATDGKHISPQPTAAWGNQQFDCNHGGDITSCDKDCAQLGVCKRRTSGALVTDSGRGV